MTVESTRGYPTCENTCSGNLPNVTLNVTAQAFERVGSVLAPSFGRTETTHETSLEVKFWEVGVPGLDSAISDAAGLCGSHLTTGPRGTAVSAKSHVDTVPSSCL